MQTKIKFKRNEHTSIEAALAQLRLRLLDLTGRNRLLNFKHTVGRSLQFVEGHPATLYQKLIDAANKPAVTIAGLPEPERMDWVERNGRLSRPDTKDWARQSGIRVDYDLSVIDPTKDQTNVRVLLYPDDLAKHCRKIEREANLAIEETGAGMLFLVLGFLEFPDQKDSDRTYQAPLLCVPVSMSKRESGGQQTFLLQYTGDDISENLSLREKLKNDHGIILPELDEDQIDVDGYFSAIQKAIKPHPRFAVRAWASLCLLSFANMLLVRDLDPSKWPEDGDYNSLLDHPIVREVFEGGGEHDGGDGGDAIEHPVEEGAGAKIPLIYDADSSQHSALIDVLIENKNLVIEGPPGTGKSQTITNLIAASIAAGKKVLFVAEKLAALNVVKTRLSLAGLDPFVLELHSNKTNKKRVLEEIDNRIKHKPKFPPDLLRMLEQVEGYRASLKTYSDLINSVAHNSFGLTIHQIIWRVEKYRSLVSNEDGFLMRITVSDADEMSESELYRRIDCLRNLAAQYSVIGHFMEESAFWGFYPNPIIPGQEIYLHDSFVGAIEWAKSFTSDVQNFINLLRKEDVGFSQAEILQQIKILEKCLEGTNEGLPLHLLPRLVEYQDATKRTRDVLDYLQTQIARYHELAATVHAGLKDEAGATKDNLSDLRDITQRALSLGIPLGTYDDTANLIGQLQFEHKRLHTAHNEITSFCAGKNVTYDATQSGLDRLSRLFHLLDDMPEGSLSPQNIGLLKDGATQALENLITLRNELRSSEEKLSEKFYLDILPAESTLKESIQVFREGSEWYRVFQSRRRQANATYKALLRNKKEKAKAPTKLSQLETLLGLIGIQERWKSDPAWAQFLNRDYTQDSQLEPLLELARWNNKTKTLLKDIGLPLNDRAYTADNLRSLHKELSKLEGAVSTALSSLTVIRDKLPKLFALGESDVLTALDSAESFIKNLADKLPWLSDRLPARTNISDCIAACEASVERQEIESKIKDNVQAHKLLGGYFEGVDTDIGSAIETWGFFQQVQRLDIHSAIKDVLVSSQPKVMMQEIIVGFRTVSAGLEKVDSFSANLRNYGNFDLGVWVNALPNGGLRKFAEKFAHRLDNASLYTDLLIPWSLYVARRNEAQDVGLNEFISFLENGKISPSDIPDAYAYCTYASIVETVFRKTPQIASFSGLKHNRIRDEFKRLDREIIKLRGQAIAVHCHHEIDLPAGRNGARVDEKTEMALINYLLPQQRPRMPVRKMLARASKSIQALKPCFMMGPQAVAQYLVPGGVKFDLIIMDEASQLKPEEAIGAIARGGQLVVVGDPKQLPPTSFFSKLGQTSDDEEQFTTTETESILDVCSSHFHPPRALRWHYRSQHHSLIAFSNLNFYRGNLIIFPSPYGQNSKLGVRATYLADAVYDNQTNAKEARRVVDAVVEHIISRGDESLGVVTLNIKQRDLIDELLTERLRSMPEAAAFREKWSAEGQSLFVKNLENVQGDERDAIIVSTTYGKPPGSKAVRQNFGPISRQDGWRRLNVLFTRAKRSVAIYTSLRPEDIVADNTTPEGTKALRNYLEYARTGILVVSEDTGAEPDSDFEVSVIDVLRNRGYEVTPQLGVAGYKIDIAVKHPDAPGTYLAAIECDGATYHSALSVRDRDRIRQEILESLGWRGRIWRIWSTDWFRTPRQETEKMLSFLDDLRKSWKPEHSGGESWVEEGGIIPQVDETQNSIEEAKNTAAQEDALTLPEDLEVRAGDLIKYIDLSKPEEILQVVINGSPTDSASGTIAETTPLAQVLLGAVVGDNVTLRVPGAVAKTFQIQEIKRQKRATP